LGLAFFSLMKMDSRVDDRHNQVGDKIHQHDGRCEKDDSGLYHGEIARYHAIHCEPVDSRPGKDGLRYDGAADQDPQLHADHKNDRQCGVTQRVFKKNQVSGNPLCLQQALDNIGSHLLGKGGAKKAVDFIITGLEV
jgi:hypothetical protein